MSKHTPGPWFQEGSEIKSGDCRPIATIRYEFAHYGEPARSEVVKEDRANARLVLAAPELLAALKDLVKLDDGDHFDGHGSELPTMTNARNAIRKAEEGQ
jgi:hypothetical protein